MIFTPLNTKNVSKKHILLFVSITFLSHEIWGKRFEWFSWFCFIFLPLPVISGDETLQQSSHQILVWTLEFLKILSSDIFEVSDGKMREDCKVYVVRWGRAGHKFLGGKIINPKTLIIKPNASSQQLWISRLLDGWMELFILRSDNKDPTWAIGQHGQCKIVRGLKLSSKRYLNQGRQRQCTGYKV